MANLKCNICSVGVIEPEVRLIAGNKVYSTFKSVLKAENYMYESELLEKQFTSMWIKVIYKCPVCGREEIKNERFYSSALRNH